MRRFLLAVVAVSLLAPWSPAARAQSAATSPATAGGMCKAEDALCACALQVIEADFASPGYAEQMTDGKVRAYLAMLVGDAAIQRRCRSVAAQFPPERRAEAITAVVGSFQ